MFSRIRRHIRSYRETRGERGPNGVPVAIRSSSALTGWFDFSGGRITGWAANTLAPSDHDLTILVMRSGEVIASTRVTEKSATVGWRFAIDTGPLVTSDDILHEKVSLFVRDSAGDMQALRLEGSTQLQLIRELLTDTAPPLLDIDFQAGGNSDSFLLEGWSGQEKIHRWTMGTESAIAFTTPPRSSDYILHLLLWPFTVANIHTGQRLRVLINDAEIGDFAVTHQTLLRCAVPSHLLPATPRVTVRFVHPDAVSPASLNDGDDPRPLALAFKKVRLTAATVD
jgi:hypothetical protein